MKYLFWLIIIIKFNSCIVDKAVLEDFKINNSTQLDLELITIEKNSFDTLLIKKNSEIILEQFHFSDQFYPYDLFGSIYLKFSDNKALKYLKTDDCASGKSFFCSNYTTCVEKVCTFEIDIIEYLKAK